ncbi:MAG: tyrosine-protein phosphatase [Clostridia bacterium]|nr:tyrosine-protein phosphatase [Clostridia bacterium]
MKRTVFRKVSGAAAFVLALVMTLVVFGCAPKREIGEVINATPSSGETVPILPERLRTLYMTFEGPETANDLATGEDLYMPEPVRISWTCANGADYYVVGLSLGKEIEVSGTEGAQYFVTTDDHIEVTELFCGKTYYYRVFAVKGSEILASIPFSFKTEDFIRTVYIDGVSNTRDLGGKHAAGGKRIKQGIIYRGAYVDPVTKQGKADFLEKLGIKCEIDLRNGTELSVFRKDINVVSVKAPMYIGGDMGIDNPEYQPELAKEIKAFADPENYPIYFHCAIGRDRTGTLACLIELLVGVSEEEIEKDYMVSFFSDLASSDEVVPGIHAGNLRNIFKFIKEYSNGNMTQNLEKFLNDIGVTNEEIKAIRENILED